MFATKGGDETVVTVTVSEKEQDPKKALEMALRKFSKEIDKESIMDEYKSRMRFEKPSAKAHRKKRLAEHRRKLGKK